MPVILSLVNFNSFSVPRISLDANLCAPAGRTELLSVSVATSSKPSNALQFDPRILLFFLHRLHEYEGNCRGGKLFQNANASENNCQFSGERACLLLAAAVSVSELQGPPVLDVSDTSRVVFSALCSWQEEIASLERGDGGFICESRKFLKQDIDCSQWPPAFIICQSRRRRKTLKTPTLEYKKSAES